VPNHEDVGSSEHQIRLSKGLIAKFVQSLKLGSAIRAGAPAARAAGFAPLSLTPGCVGDLTVTFFADEKATSVVAFCAPSSVTETVLYFKSSKSGG
jgi:hypothetical protein